MKPKGFSLIKIIVVVAIIEILATIGVLTYKNFNNI